MTKIKDMNYSEFVLYLKRTHKVLNKSEIDSEVLYAWICKKLLKDIQKQTQINQKGE
jgi:hypothetical protein